MKAKELSEILLEHPDFDIYVGVQKYISNSREYSYEYVDVPNDMIDIDTIGKAIFIGDEQ
jgi:hypothetical protein